MACNQCHCRVFLPTDCHVTMCSASLLRNFGANNSATKQLLKAVSSTILSTKHQSLGCFFMLLLVSFFSPVLLSSPFFTEKITTSLIFHWQQFISKLAIGAMTNHLIRSPYNIVQVTTFILSTIWDTFNCVKISTIWSFVNLTLGKKIRD